MVRTVVLFLMVFIGITRTKAAVTNEDIRVAILQIVNVVRSTEDKLERHEFRDRSVSEQLKKGMINIDRKIKMLDPLKGTVSRLDERLAAVETILMQKNEAEKMQLQRTYEVVIDIQKNLPVLLDEMKNDIISKISAHEPPAQITEPLISKKDLEKLEKEFINKIDKVSSSIGKIETELPKLKEDSKNVKDIHNKSSDNLEKLKKHINENQQLLTKYDKKLSEYNNKIPSIPSDKEQSAWKQTILKALDAQKATTKDILQDIKNLQNQIKQLPQKDDVTKSHNNILNKLTNGTNCLVPSLERDLNKVLVTVNRSHDDTIRNINGLTEVTATLMKSFANTNKAIESQKTTTNEVLQDVRNLQNKLTQSDNQSTVLKKLEEILNKINNNPSVKEIKQTLSKINDNLNSSHGDIARNINGLTEITATLLTSLSNTNNAIDLQKTDIKDISRNLTGLSKEINQVAKKQDIQSNQQIIFKKIEETCNSKKNDEDLQHVLSIIINRNHDDIIKNLHNLTDIASNLIQNVPSSNALDNQNKNVDEILQNMKILHNQISQLPQKDAERKSLRQLEEILNNTQQNHNEVRQILNNVDKNINSSNNDTISNINGLSKITAVLMKSLANANNAIESQKATTNEILQDVRNLQNKLEQSNDQSRVLRKLEDIYNNPSMNEIKQTLSKVNDNINSSHDNIVRNINGLTEITATLLTSLSNTNYAIDLQKTDIKDISRNLTGLSKDINLVAQKHDIEANREIIFKKIEEICSSKNNAEDLQSILTRVTNNINKNHDDIIKNLHNLTDTATNLTKNVPTNYVLNSQKTGIEEIQQYVKNLQSQINQLPEKLDIKQNTTLQELEKLSDKISGCQKQSIDNIENILEDMKTNVNKTNEDTIEKLNDLSEITATLGNNFVSSYGKLRTDIQNLNGLDQVMIKTADSVIDTKRRVEFAVHHIIAEMSKRSKEDTKNINQAISDRFDIFEQSILDEDTGALANVTSKIEGDIQQVWRQIGIMYQQMSSNSEALKQLQNQTEAYVNGSLGTMNNVKGKVTQITGRITEVDENLNYLLGRLSLVTQEFNRIKSGLTAALDQIRGSFQTVQNKLNEGPGPHPIGNDEGPIA